MPSSAACIDGTNLARHLGIGAGDVLKCRSEAIDFRSYLSFLTLPIAWQVCKARHASSLLGFESACCIIRNGFLKTAGVNQSAERRYTESAGEETFLRGALDFLLLFWIALWILGCIGSAVESC